jgi:PrtD family type I secretion system ABC transporter
MTAQTKPTMVAQEPAEQGSELPAVMKSFRGAFAGLGAFSGVSNVLMLTGPIFMLEIYDRVLPSHSLPTLVVLALFAAALFAAQGLIDWLRGRVLVRIAGALDEAISGRVYDVLVRLALRRGAAGSSGMEPVRDMEAVRSFLSGLGPTTLFDLPWIPLYLGVVFAFHPLLGVIATAGGVVLFVLTMLAEMLAQQPMKSALESWQKRQELAEAGRRNAEAITAMGFGARLAERWRRLNREHVADHQRASDVTGSLGAISKVSRMILQSAILAIGAYLVIDQQVTAGVIVASSILTARALAPVDLTIAYWKPFIAARQGWQRLGKLLTVLPPEAPRMELPAPRETLSVESVTLAAPGSGRLVVQNVSFSLRARQALGIIGPSASGKSCLARALVGVWPPVRGHVRLDGASLDQWAEASRGRHIGYLPQDVELFAGTVAQNIARFDPEATAEKIIAAAQTAGVHDMIVNFEAGYETEVGENGVELSAGQRQRIALARALYGEPFLVVLDEPNSNLDADGETALTRAIMSVRRRNGIVVVIAHRPSALAAADTILVMRQGRLETIGAKKEVLPTVVRAIDGGQRRPVAAVVAR